MKHFRLLFLSFMIVLYAFPVHAQFTFDGQYLQRAEYRHGYGRLIEDGEDYAAFIGHRARLQGTFKKDRLTLYMSVQDVRIWGNTPQLKFTDGFLSVHEAWGEYHFSDSWSSKIGRQELNYDNVRFLGNVDWTLQGRAHDFALIKFEREQQKLHFGAGYNQGGEALSGNILWLENQYKTAQFMRYENKWGHFFLSALFWNDGRQFVDYDPNGEILRQGIRYRSTLGIPTIRYTVGNTTLAGFAYYQFGKDLIHRDLRAWNANAQVTQQIDIHDEKGTRLRATIGIETLSGTPINDASVNRSYSPLYGTNHAHNGYMDLFYVGGRFEHSVGIHDIYLRARYDFNRRLFLQSDLHYFLAQADLIHPTLDLDQYLGTEVDFTLGYVLNDDISVQAGYSQFFASDNFKLMTSAIDAKPIQNWAYLMFIYRPTMKAKFVGLLL